jgi:hypothetical protein
MSLYDQFFKSMPELKAAADEDQLFQALLEMVGVGIGEQRTVGIARYGYALEVELDKETI